jgi:formate-dependent nitrite reductase membrane component NrfD
MSAAARARPDVGSATRPASAHGTSPYGRPVIKQPTWTPEIPMYFYTGGLAGASAGLALLCDLTGRPTAARRAWLTAFAGSVVSPVLLISDLGKPSRFLHMLRMFKVSSPMSVGSWVLASFGTVTAPATAHALLRGGLGPAGRGAQVAAAVLGLPLSSYTAALVANTAVPVWHHARVELPFVFAAGAATSAGAMAAIAAPVEEAGPARRLAVGGALVEVALTQAMERRLKAVGVGAPYHEGAAGTLAKAATALTLAGAALVAARGRRSRAAAVGGGALLTAGAVAERWAIFRAGFQSVARPQDTIDPQRAAIRSGRRKGASRLLARRPAPEAPPARDASGPRRVPPGSPAIDPGPGGHAG